MKYMDRKIQEENKFVAEIGDCIYANNNLYVITNGWVDNKNQYQAIYMTGVHAFNGAGLTRDSIKEIVDFYRDFEDFEIIKSDEIEIVRRK